MPFIGGEGACSDATPVHVQHVGCKGGLAWLYDVGVEGAYPSVVVFPFFSGVEESAQLGRGLLVTTGKGPIGGLRSGEVMRRDCGGMQGQKHHSVDSNA